MITHNNPCEECGKKRVKLFQYGKKRVCWKCRAEGRTVMPVIPLLTERMTLFLTPQQHTELNRTAKFINLNMSQYLRSLIVRDLESRKVKGGKQNGKRRKRR